MSEKKINRLTQYIVQKRFCLTAFPKASKEEIEIKDFPAD